ncbi:MAG: shikimate dehydrogenase [Ardenticatenaceae bacterium]
METLIPTRVGLFGWPVGHSRSPAMHNAAFGELGLNWEYMLLPVRLEDVYDAVRGLRALGFAGANVTVPHKLAVMEALDEVMPEAQAIGAVNTIVNRDGYLVGYNTDGIGFLRALREGGFEPKNCRALLLGAGGASRAVLHALLTEGAEVTIVNRTLSRAQKLAEEFGSLFGVQVHTLAFDSPVALQKALDEANLLVNATSLGMHPHPDATPVPAHIHFHPSLTVYDLVYNPLETRLLAEARAAGAQAIDGLGMLIHQGAVAFTLWTGKEAPVEVMRAAAMAK